jgi:hypothetical protein
MLWWGGGGTGKQAKESGMRAGCGTGVLIGVLGAALAGGWAMCSAAAEAQAEAEGRKGVCIYLLKEEKLSAPQAAKMPLAELPLREEPWIAAASIERYDASVHLIYLKQPVGKAWDRINLSGTPFVVTADGERCYMGALWSIISSFSPPKGVPVINGPVWGKGGTDLVALHGDAKVLSDERVLRVLKRDGQFSAGIELILDKVLVVPVGAGAAIRYTYTVTNRDRDALYLLDTDRMDYDYFRRMQKGIAALIDLDGEGHVGRPNPLLGMKELPLPHDKVDPNWFVRLASGEGMTRTATEPHFRRVPTGRYSCLFHYGFLGHGLGLGGPTGRAAREREDGRVWLGRLSASREVRVTGPVEF